MKRFFFCIALFAGVGAQAAIVAIPASQRWDAVVASDCGTEIDDQWAIIYAALSPKLRIRGWTGALAPNLPAPSTTYSLNCIGEIVHGVLGFKDQPLFPGSAQPLQSSKDFHDSPAARFLLKASRGHDRRHPLIVISLGALTDIASANLIDPGFQNRAQVWMMGFGQWPQGGDEWNVANDKVASNVVLDSNIPMIVVSAEVSEKDLDLTNAQIDKLLGGRRDRASRWLYAATLKFMKAHANDFHDHKVMFDVGAPAVLFGLGKMEFKRRPHMMADFSFGYTEPPRGQFAWVTDFHSEKLWADFARKLDKFAREF